MKNFKNKRIKLLIFDNLANDGASMEKGLNFNNKQ
jgi:hypothetical protein